MNLEIFSHSQQPLFSFLPSVYFTFIGQGSYFSKFLLKTFIASLFLFARRKRAIIRRTVMISSRCFRCTFLFFFFSWVADPFMVRFSFRPVCGVSRFWSCGLPPIIFLSNASFMDCYSFLSLRLSSLKFFNSA